MVFVHICSPGSDGRLPGLWMDLCEVSESECQCGEEAQLSA